MKNLSQKLLLLALATFGLVSCYPEGAEYIEDLDTATTLVDEENKETLQKLTYSIPWKVAHIGEDSADYEFTEMDAFILEEVKSNMDALGYQYISDQEIENGTNPDLMVTCSSVAITYAGVVDNWWYWWGYYPGWGYPGWGYPGWNPYYPPMYSTYSYTTGSVLVDIFDNEVDPNDPSDTPDGVWRGIVNGVLAGSQNSVETRLVDGINQCFDQSEYLGPIN